MGHHHHHHDQLAGRNLLISIVINLVITIAQAIGGFISGSLSLLSDALHNFSDIISLLISYIANKMVGKNADFSKTFGYKRAEIIAAFVNAGILIVIAVYLIKESIFRFFEPPEPVGTGLVIWLAIFAIAGNGISALLLYKGSKTNINIKSSYLHLFTDMLTSVAVLIGGLLMKFFEIYWVDSLLTLIIGGYLIYTGIILLKSAFNVLMLFSPDDIEIDELVQRISTIDGIKNMHHIHIWQLNEHEIHLEAHIDFHRDIHLSEFDCILEQIEKVVYKEFNINHVNIQPEFDKKDNKSVIVQD